MCRPCIVDIRHIVGFYPYYGNEAKSIEYLRKGFNASRVRNNQYSLCLTFINLANSALANDNFKDSHTLASQFRSSLKERSTPEAKYGLILADATQQAADGNYSGAIASLKKIPDVLNGFFLDNRAKFDANANIARMFLKAGMNDSAVAYMKRAELYAISERQTDIIIEATKGLADIYDKVGNKQDARKYRYRWLELQDSLFNLKGLSDVHNLEMAYEAHKFGQKIERLTIEKDFRMKLFLFSAIGIIILAGMLLVVIRFNRKLVIKNRNLFQKNLDILALKKSGSEVHRSSDEPLDEPPTDGSDSDPGEDKSAYVMAPADMELLWSRIAEVMADEQVFCNQDFTLQKLSDMLQSNVKYVSQTINQKTGQSFSNYLSEKRIDVACQRFIDNDNYGQLTLEGIIKGVGYKSRSSFTKTFKRHTGLTPSEYRKLALEEKPRLPH